MEHILRVSMLAILVALSGGQPLPEPLSFAPSTFWDGNDGPWSSLAFQIGSPAQSVRLLPSTSKTPFLVMVADACSSAIPWSCEESRGSFFNITTSSSWKNLGTFGTANFTGQLLGYNGATTYGFDTVVLGLPGAGGLRLSNQIIGSSGSKDYYTGIFGLSPESNVKAMANQKPSLLGILTAQNLIPSSSYSYTAGAYYRDQRPLASLTFGGYDSSLFITHNISFPFSNDISRRLGVNIQSIRIDNSSATDATLLPEPISALIDSTDPYIRLPIEACRRFEDAFNLVWNETQQMYSFKTTQTTTAKSGDTSITFTLAENSTSSAKVDLVFPFSAFELMTGPLITRNGTTQRYFPLKRAANDTQYVLGRTFLQETYLIVNYEQSNFSIYQAAFPGPGAKKNLVPIQMTRNATSQTTNKSKSKKTTIIGSVVAIVGTLVVGILLVIWLHKREGVHQKKRGKVARLRSIALMELDASHSAEARQEADGKELQSPVEVETPVERLELSSEKDELGSRPQPVENVHPRQKVIFKNTHELDGRPRYPGTAKA